MLKHRRRPRCDERGSIALEFVGTFGLVLLMALIAWQALVAMHTLTETNYAARDAARAEVISNGSGPEAGKSSLSSHLRGESDVWCSTSDDAVTCEVQVQIPLIGSAALPDNLHQPTVTRSATMPNIGEE